MSTLGKLFSSEAIVKIMRLFLLHPDQPFENKDIAKRSKVSPNTLRTEMNILSSVGFVRKKSFSKETKQKTKKGTPKKKKVSGWELNGDFPHLNALKLLLLSSQAVNKTDIIKRVRSTGKIKLIVLSGIFIHEEGSRVDMLVVGDKINKKRLENALKHLEAEVGKELEYAAIDTSEFSYRYGMYDKFVRDILDYPHEKLMDRIGL